jgi:hypothetical protein
VGERAAPAPGRRRSNDETDSGSTEALLLARGEREA